MNAIIISGIVLTVLLLSILLGKKHKLYADRFLISYLVFSLINYSWLYLESIGYFQQGNWILLGKVAYLLNAPLFFFYVHALTSEKPLLFRYYLLMLLAPLGYIIHFIYYNGWGFAVNEVFIENGLLYINQQLSLSWAFFVCLFLISDPVYLVLFYIRLTKYKKRLLQSASYIDHINLNWITLLFYTWFVPAIVLIPAAVFSLGSNRVSIELLLLLLAAANVLSTFIIGYYGFKQTTVFSDLSFVTPEADTQQELTLPSHESKSASYERSGLSKDQAQVHHRQLLALMKEKKPYLDGELNAPQLAFLLGVSVNHLSQILNQEQRQNFFDFVNHYRVEEVKEKMKLAQYRNLTLLAIALESGFNSKTSFNTLFKKFTGQTPSHYYKLLPKE